MKASSFMADNILDPKTATSQELLDAPFSRAFGREPLFEFLEKPGNEYRLRRFGAAMHGVTSAIPPGALLVCKSSCWPSTLATLTSCPKALIGNLCHKMHWSLTLVEELGLQLCS